MEQRCGFWIGKVGHPAIKNCVEIMGPISLLKGFAFKPMYIQCYSDFLE